MEYFEKICSEIHSDAKWIFSCHDSAGLKAINAFVKTMAIGADTTLGPGPNVVNPPST